jgi:DNA-binding CsgD family transcriptional regulator
MELLERTSQLSTLTALLRDAEAGYGRLALVAGDAGSGKTALLRNFSDTVAASTPPLWGMCDPMTTPRPLGPLLDIAPQLGGELVHALKNASRGDVFDSTLTALASRDRASVIVFEDMHWADEATLDLLSFLGRRLGALRLLMVATYREDQVGADHPLRLVFGDLASVEGVTWVTVPPLSLDAVTHLASGRSIDAVRLHHETGGNAFFVTEVLSSASDRLPPTIAHAVLTRAARLSASARAALDAAAVVGPRIEPAVIRRMRDVDDRALDECVDSGMLQFDSPCYEFRHELARQAVLNAITPARRSALHGEALSVLRDQPSGADKLERLSYHAEAADDVAATLEYAPAAAQVAASLQSHRAAAMHYRRALRFADALAPDARAGLLRRASYEHHLIAEFGDATSMAEQALAISRQLGDRLAEGDTLRWLSRANWIDGRTKEAVDAAGAAVATLESQRAPHELAKAYASKAQLSMLMVDPADVELWAEKAIRLATELDDQPTLINVLNSLGTARVRAGDRGGLQLLHDSLRGALQLGLEEDAARAWNNLAAVSSTLLDLGAVREYVDAGTQYCIDHDLHVIRSYLTTSVAELHLAAGRWGEAASLADGLLRDPRFPRHFAAKIVLLSVIAKVRTRRGEGDAQPLLDEAVAVARSGADLPWMHAVAAARAESAWYDGRHGEVEREVAPALAMALAAREPRAIGELSYWMWKVGRLRTPVDAAALPYALQIKGDWKAAHAMWSELGFPYEAALALADSDDEADLRAAIASLATLGARPAIAEVTQRLRALGATSIPRGPRPRTRQNPAGLTAREMDILALLSQGLHNSEIARRLFLSPKTVDHHVSAILAKLDVRSRSEAVARARELVPAGERP